MSKRFMVLLFILCFVLLVGACSSEEAPKEMVKVNLPMGYIPDPQYAPFYVAVEKGYFVEEGIDIEFDYSFETDGLALVGANERQFAIVSGDQVILARAQNIPVVYIFEWFQKYPIAIVSKSEANIKTPQDLVGRNVGLPGYFGTSYVGYLGLLSANDLLPRDVNGHDIGFTQIESLLADQTEAVVGYANNEPVQLASIDQGINVLYVSDYIDMVANGVITNETIIEENPELVERFLRAMYRGLVDTLADPQAAYETSKAFVSGLDDERMGVLEASIAMWEADELGKTTADSWLQTQNVMLSAGLLDKPVENLDEAFTNEFVEKIQED